MKINIGFANDDDDDDKHERKKNISLCVLREGQSNEDFPFIISPQFG